MPHKILAIINTILIIFVSSAAYVFVPEFIKLFNGFGAALPFVTALVLVSYKYWIILLLVPVGIYAIYLTKPQLSKIEYNVILGVLVALLIFVVLLIPIAVTSMYLPIFELGKKI